MFKHENLPSSYSSKWVASLIMSAAEAGRSCVPGRGRNATLTELLAVFIDHSADRPVGGTASPPPLLWSGDYWRVQWCWRLKNVQNSVLHWGFPLMSACLYHKSPISILKKWSNSLSYAYLFAFIPNILYILNLKLVVSCVNHIRAKFPLGSMCHVGKLCFHYAILN